MFLYFWCSTKHLCELCTSFAVITWRLTLSCRRHCLFVDLNQQNQMWSLCNRGENNFKCSPAIHFNRQLLENVCSCLHTNNCLENQKEMQHWNGSNWFSAVTFTVSATRRRVIDPVTSKHASQVPQPNSMFHLIQFYFVYIATINNNNWLKVLYARQYWRKGYISNMQGLGECGENGLLHGEKR